MQDRSRARRWILALALALSVAALVQANHRITRGRSGVLKWMPAAAALERGEPIYQVGEEGYPTLPLTLLVLRPFQALGERAGPLAWALFELACAWWIVTRAFALAAGRASAFPVWGQLFVLLVSFRVLQSEVLHGNVNLFVGAVVAGAAWSWARGRALASGAWIGLAAVLKVTPALALVYFAQKRSGRALAGVALGVALGAFALPALALGWERNLELAGAWWQQMIVPYARGRELGLLQTEQINQSLLGVLARLTTDSVAIAARPPVFEAALRVNVLALGPVAFRALHVGACAAVLAALLASLRPWREPRTGLATLGELSLVALAMLLLSERSWKHHAVLSPFPLAFLCWHALRARGTPRLVSIAALSLFAALSSLSGSAVLGARGSDLAEAYGVHLLAWLALFAGCAVALRRLAPATQRGPTPERRPASRSSPSGTLASEGPDQSYSS